MAQAAWARIERFAGQEAAPGITLMLAALLALIVNNSPLSPLYTAFLAVPIEVQVGALQIAKPLLLWVNDGLMAIFFFLVGLEIKREVLEGELSRLDRAILPVVAAIGGITIPAMVFVLINQGVPANLDGWAIPAATDIAFALGILALLGSRVPVALKILLLAIAIIDDLAAIVIIALFYTADLSIVSLLIGLVGFALLLGLNRIGVTRTAPYLLIGLVIWVAVLKSGVHATLAGVMIALTIPMRAPNSAPEGSHGPLLEMEHGLKPWVSFLVLPLFAFANAGVSLQGISFSDLLAPLPLGIALGLFIGKQVGVFSFIWVLVKTGVGGLPQGVNWLHIYGVACLTGIGFTMSLFIGSLAFDDAAQMDAVRLGVLLGSVSSAILGIIVLRLQAPAVGTDTAESADIGPGAATRSHAGF
ncbi:MULTISPECIES: Na+/H+ antiporter NhaA [unclassified Minwuia]|jgi:Na+:H+ antiporter, NhaA family|uniref:Na+/H+ antiporter NhaA n=1 Tax=unclassified Minwuia TaxID=2618799 RepID=UPI00247A31BD|nr:MULTISPECIES: Na+/H+ antiporter NhaA [unclassified Minwuia]